MVEFKAWALPLLVAALVVPPVTGFLVAGPALGLALGLVATGTLAVTAIKLRSRAPITVVEAEDDDEHVLLVATTEIDDSAIAKIDRAATASLNASATDVLVLVPTRTRFLDRWASDVESARVQAQERLVVAVASLAKAGVDAQAAVGDEELVQAIEDQLGTFPATEVLLATGPPGHDSDQERAIEELEQRLGPPLSRIALESAG
jgi:hypothetical protein